MSPTAPPISDPEDVVVLVDPDGTPRGVAPRASVHTESTPLHRAFSCHVVREDGRVLLTRRALTKRTWPGVWTNSVCGHPRPGEDDLAAISRRAQDELGLAVHDVQCVLPGYRYRAQDASGVVENEICPVYLARATAEPMPHPDEVMDLRWVDPAELTALVGAAPWIISPWAAEQLARLGPLLAADPAVRE
ncbi:isopentenyl-diphosphate Delta-isomerase [Brachybacterium sp. J153]|uniref:isopentenyl-diphosphate Delta-isomerase n=1 Tax=Brachybacterium sp. J153 TaxID=3116488 RepID=UPI002E7AA632|nr:isopentenyl-diphosphate Delta-isomerase [Brachybacterium sp. J153]MEE1618569.1 isopentenyl-diphosphate Delta-isomerase [Brachybacterium sp. J153]